MQAEAGPSKLADPSTQPAKHTPCRYFFRSGRCRRGDKCQFSHKETRQTCQSSTAPSSSPTPSPDERLSAHAPEYTPTSRTQSQLSATAQVFEPSLQIGGVDQHEWQDEVPEPQPSASASATNKSKLVTIGVPASISQNVEPCSICMEVPAVYAQHINCDHFFCPPCLRQWRRQHGLAKIKNCPICRASSHYTFVTPQPFTAAARTLALQRFRERVASTPCKNFTKSLQLSKKRMKPFCIYGDDCVYRHEIDTKPYKFGEGKHKINNGRKGIKRIVRPVRGSRSSFATEFHTTIQGMDARLRMFLSTRVLLSTRGNTTSHSSNPFYL
ncbi:related to makorin ring zinc finger protein [Melanopsichium pennsylvanicum]|uniref:Related to makorin ring zinc finger protein n=2 Tax=Melanopsichium pennsylvanicum TaxID=63383 RepID=A0AAJ4XH77_9BASI|nr:related to makorin ring zinc finger protein [Melanopsichium pennsylvanicum 4]SNX82339.1 related to makorin ring zinc finger protein [Melanopsichium pennsylvanicum]